MTVVRQSEAPSYVCGGGSPSPMMQTRSPSDDVYLRKQYHAASFTRLKQQPRHARRGHVLSVSSRSEFLGASIRWREAICILQTF
ncbi:uncharacterized protein B0I36DRAFT_310407 [Microdochium trichocladiopsis]|uniref:Uncharacterized protein n=1 Tax=Microdochium trichocladiopsis TaxID=1682393 RepID=A0A9P8YHW1_9PEZI|nr:uncharacterized protein B0I36DRAFT_310407 [Microdochium trichocladiopsis]KAH7040297.1 hypothetical protein B0I36DRAFT_310407 [Microdochium trichocladiopsis]